SRACEEHPSPHPHKTAALRARPPRRGRTRSRGPGVSGFGGERCGRKSAMALHRGVRRHRAVGPGERSHGQNLDRRLRAISGASVMDAAAARQATSAVPSIPCDAEGPVFREPWEAQAFAMALALHERGVFTWAEWAETLGA